MSGGESLDTEYGTELGTYGQMSGGQVVYYEGSSREYGYGKLEGFLLGDVLSTQFITEGGSYDGSSDGIVDIQVDGYSGVTNKGD